MSQFKKYLQVIQEVRTPEERKEYKNKKREKGTGYTWRPSVAGGRTWYLPQNPEPSDIANTIREYLNMDYSPTVAGEIVSILKAVQKENDFVFSQLEKNTRLKQEMSKFFEYTIIKLKDLIEKYDKGEIGNKNLHSH